MGGFDWAAMASSDSATFGAGATAPGRGFRKNSLTESGGGHRRPIPTRKSLTDPGLTRPARCHSPRMTRVRRVVMRTIAPFQPGAGRQKVTLPWITTRGPFRERSLR